MDKRIKLLCVTGLLTAAAFVFTAYLHVPSYTGYVHVGDAFIFLASCMLPLPYAVFVGAVGAGLADLLTGFAIWAPGSLIIKGLAVLLFSRKTDKMITVRNIIALLPATALCVGGYYLYEALITGNFAAPVAGMPGNALQSVLSGIIFILLGLALDKIKLKEKLLKQ